MWLERKKRKKEMHHWGRVMWRNENGRGREREKESDSPSPPGANWAWPPSACDSQPNRSAVRWFKVIITSTLADGWCLSRGCWCLMNETLVNTTKNMIREPPCRQQARRREKKMSTQMCLHHHHHPHIHTRITLPSLASLSLDCPIPLFLLITFE